MKKTILWSLVLGMFVSAPASVFASDGDDKPSVSVACKKGIKTYVKGEKAKDGFSMAKCKKHKRKKISSCNNTPVSAYIKELHAQCKGDASSDSDKPSDKSAESEAKPSESEAKNPSESSSGDEAAPTTPAAKKNKPIAPTDKDAGDKDAAASGEQEK